MDSVGEAVTYKIREAITSKLIELSVPFEKELPDYIMVMVANKKSRPQMEEDLFLFLGDGTGEFMNWFDSVMKKFQSNSLKQLDDVNFAETSDSKVCNVNSFSQGTLEPTITTKQQFNWSSESDILTLIIPEQDSDFLGEELKEVSRSSLIPCTNDNKAHPGTLGIKVVPSSIDSKLVKELSASKKKLRVQENIFQQKAKIVPCSAVVPVKRSKTSPEDDCEAGEQPFGSVASIIRVTERKSSVPPALQANKLLLLKAVAAANKSVMAQQGPFNYLRSNYEENCKSKCDLPVDKDIRIAVLDEEAGEHSSLICAKKSVSTASSYLLPESGHQSENIVYPTIIPKLTDLVESCDVEMVYSPEDQPFEENSSAVITRAPDSSKAIRECETEEKSSRTWSSVTPRFVVTLDGFDPSTLKRKCVDVEEENDSAFYPRVILDTDSKKFVPLVKEPTSSVEKKMKINEKCRYWPACKSGDLCCYHHPTTICKAFPNCMYGDKCLFIHPNCKFDALCTRKDCPYTHASKRKIPAVTDSLPSGKSHSSTVISCRYFPNCAAKNCPYFHPRTCWYGSLCKLPDCPYSHSLPVRNQLKWCA